jgi:hypothetical protein
MGDFLLEQLVTLSVTAEKRAIGTHVLEGKEVDLPPVIIGQIGNDPKKVRSATVRSPFPFPLLSSWIHLGPPRIRILSSSRRRIREQYLTLP